MDDYTQLELSLKMRTLFVTDFIVECELCFNCFVYSTAASLY